MPVRRTIDAKLGTLLRALAAVYVLVPLPAAAQTTPVVAFGDSLSIGFREDGVDCDDPIATAKGYGEHLEDQLQSTGQMVQVFPRGICGERTSQGLTRIDSVLAEGTFQGRTGVLIAMEGTNDISTGSISVESISTNLKMIAEKAAAKGWSPVYSGIIPYGPPVDVQNRNGRAEFLAEAMEEIAKTEARPFADPFHDLSTCRIFSPTSTTPMVFTSTPQATRSSPTRSSGPQSTRSIAGAVRKRTCA